MKFKKNDPIDINLLRSIYADEDVLLKAWPSAKIPFCEDQWHRWFENSDEVQTHSFLLQEDGELRAHGALKMYTIEPGLCYMCLIAVKKDYQSQGLGRKLIHEILLYCHKSLGLSEVYLLVYKENKRALDFYRKLGFQLVDGENPLRLRINLGHS